MITLASAWLAVGNAQPALGQTSSPSTTVSPYLTSHLPGLDLVSILTVDDGSVPKTGGGTTRLVGIPVVRDHGNIGAFVWKTKAGIPPRTDVFSPVQHD